MWTCTSATEPYGRTRAPCWWIRRLSAHKEALEEIARLSGARLDVTALELSQLADVVSVQEAEEDREAVTALLPAMEPALRRYWPCASGRRGHGGGFGTAAEQTIARALEAIERRAPETVAGIPRETARARIRAAGSARGRAPGRRSGSDGRTAATFPRKSPGQSHIAQLGSCSPRLSQWGASWISWCRNSTGKRTRFPPNRRTSHRC